MLTPNTCIKKKVIQLLIIVFLIILILFFFFPNNNHHALNFESDGRKQILEADWLMPSLIEN